MSNPFNVGPSAAHDLGALAAGLAQVAEDLASRTHVFHARPGEQWRDCQANSQACNDAARLVCMAEALAVRAVDADDFTDRLAAYAEAIYR